MNDSQFGFRTGDLEIIINVIRQVNSINKAIIFGSRAKGTYKNGSDVDIALKGDINFKTVSHLRFILNEETNLPYKFDVLNYDQINNDELRKHIDRVGIVFYKH